MSGPDLEALLAGAIREGRRVAVGALIRDAKGRVFVHRRGPDRRFLPNCWDIVGGHVEPGEDLLGALRREVEEETGWRVNGTPMLVHSEDWVAPGPAGPEPHREFDFLVEVDGDLDRPRIEHPKHVEHRWIGPDDVAILDENKGADDGFIRRIVEATLRREGAPVKALLALAEHNAWANARVFEECGKLPTEALAGEEAYDSILGILQHLVQVEHNFLALAHGRERMRTLPITLEEAAEACARIDREYIEYARSLDPVEADAKRFLVPWFGFEITLAEGILSAADALPQAPRRRLDAPASPGRRGGGDGSHPVARGVEVAEGVTGYWL